MAEEYRIIARDGVLHLEEAGVFGNDLGALHRTFSGKLETRNLFSTNYTLEDVSEMFASGERYKMTNSDGEVGYLTKKAFHSDTYSYKSA